MESLLALVGMPTRAVPQQMLRNEYAAEVKQVAGPDPTPLETLLAKRVFVCRMQMTHYERTYAAQVRNASEDDITPTFSERWQKRMDSLHKRYVSVIKGLAYVRRQQLPSVQVHLTAEGFNPDNGLRLARLDARQAQQGM